MATFNYSCVAELGHPASFRHQLQVDPGKLGDGERLETNFANLKGYIQETFAAISKSAYQCPSTMCRVFAALKRQARLYFPGERRHGPAPAGERASRKRAPT